MIIVADPSFTSALAACNSDASSKRIQFFAKTIGMNGVYEVLNGIFGNSIDLVRILHQNPSADVFAAIPQAEQAEERRRQKSRFFAISQVGIVADSMLNFLINKHPEAQWLADKNECKKAIRAAPSHGFVKDAVFHWQELPVHLDGIWNSYSDSAETKWRCFLLGGNSLNETLRDILLISTANLVTDQFSPQLHIVALVQLNNALEYFLPWPSNPARFLPP